jgi:hypothetical protein
MEANLALEREAQTLRLELEAARREIERLQELAGRQRTQGDDRVSEAVATIQGELMANLAAPVAQIMMQAHLHDVEGKPVPVRDVLNVTRRLVRTLGDAGLVLEGAIGDPTAFDPDKHEPLGDFHPAAGDPVVVRMVGVSYHGRHLRRAGVVTP